MDFNDLMVFGIRSFCRTVCLRFGILVEPDPDFQGVCRIQVNISLRQGDRDSRLAEGFIDGQVQLVDGCPAATADPATKTITTPNTIFFRLTAMMQSAIHELCG